MAGAGLGPPPLPPGLVSRLRLVDRLRSADVPLLLVTAPAGYGKTTLLADWVDQDKRPFAWLSIRPAHEDPAFLLACVTDVLSAISPIDPAVAESLAGPNPDLDAVVLPRLQAALQADRDPFVLVMDDVHSLESNAAFEVIGALAEAVPDSSRLVIAVRTEPQLSLGGMRATRRLVEVDQGDLAMTHAESRELLLGIGLDLESHQVDALYQRTEGWPAALYLAGLALLGVEDLDAAIADFAGDDRLVADYFRDEFIADASTAELRFLTRTSILDRLSGPLCDAVLERSGSGQELRRHSRSNLLLTRLDHRDEWFRYHPLFREMLVSELRRSEASAEPDLHRRASGWYAKQEDLDRAIDHAIAAVDFAAAGDLIWASVPPQNSRGRVSTIDRWLERFDDQTIASRPTLALSAAHVSLARGDGETADRWISAAEAAVADRSEAVSAEVEAGLLMTRATIGRSGVAQMRRDAAAAYEIYGEDDLWRSLCCLIEGTALCLGGDAPAGRTRLHESARRGVGAPLVQTVANAQLALMTTDSDRHAASELMAQSMLQLDRYGFGDYPGTALTFAAAALFHAHAGQTDEAAAEAAEGLRLLDKMRDYIPWIEIETRVVLARALIRLGEVSRSRQLLAEASGRLERFPDAPLLASWIEEARASLKQVSTEAGLTPAELRVLQFMPTHLSFREIAQHLYVSPNTVKTQAQAIYRKLGVSARAEAVDFARNAGLLDEDEITTIG